MGVFMSFWEYYYLGWGLLFLKQKFGFFLVFEHTRSFITVV